MAKPGPKELQRRALREASAVPGKHARKMIFESPPCVGHSMPKTETPPAPPATQETAVKKTTKKTAAKRKPTAKKATSAKAPKAAASKARKGKKPVPAIDVANYICRPKSKDNPLGGASMAELEKRFGIEAHPMRAKIYYVKHELGFDVVSKEGRYYGAAPKDRAGDDHGRG